MIISEVEWKKTALLFGLSRFPIVANEGLGDYHLERGYAKISVINFAVG